MYFISVTTVTNTLLITSNGLNFFPAFNFINFLHTLESGVLERGYLGPDHSPNSVQSISIIFQIDPAK